jgi:hypothetical protein
VKHNTPKINDFVKQNTFTRFILPINAPKKRFAPFSSIYIKSFQKAI